MKRRRFLETLATVTASSPAFSGKFLSQPGRSNQNPRSAHPASKGKKIRLAMVRADTHGYFYGMMLDDCDPPLLQKNNYVVHHYASNIYDPSKLTMPRVSGFEITKIYVYKLEMASAFSETFFKNPSFAEVSKKQLRALTLFSSPTAMEAVAII